MRYRSKSRNGRFICDKIPHIDMIRMVNSGTEAVMSALRVARGYTGKNKIIKMQAVIMDIQMLCW